MDTLTTKTGLQTCHLINIYVRALRVSLHYFVLSNSIHVATRPINGQKSIQLYTYRVIAEKQKQSQDSFKLIPVKKSLVYM